MRRMLVLVAVTVILVVARTAPAQPTSGPASAPTSAPTAPRGVAARPAPPAPPPPPASRPAVAPARGTRGQEIRFDALRIDGALHGPEAVTIRSDLARRERPLHSLRRSFLLRILRTVESPCLHR